MKLKATSNGTPLLSVSVWVFEATGREAKSGSRATSQVYRDFICFLSSFYDDTILKPYSLTAKLLHNVDDSNGNLKAVFVISDRAQCWTISRTRG